MNPRYKYILFDIDGVIIHAETWSSEFTRRFGLPSDALNEFFSGIFRECILGKADLREGISPFLEKWWYSENVDTFLKDWFDYENCPDVALIEMIQKLRNKGIRCFLATNQEKYRLNYLRENMGFWEKFDGIFCSAEIGWKKPQREYYEYILRELVSSWDDILYFDDSEENVASAREIWIHSVLYRDRDDLSCVHNTYPSVHVG